MRATIFPLANHRYMHVVDRCDGGEKKKKSTLVQAIVSRLSVWDTTVLYGGCMVYGGTRAC